MNRQRTLARAADAAGVSVRERVARYRVESDLGL
jgi:hypothetical protein